MKVRALGQGLAAFLLLGTSTWGAISRVEPFASWYYPLAWWSYILLVDALVLAIQGHSPLSRSHKDFLHLAALSVPLWLTFELWNLSIKNWYYIRVAHFLPLRWVGYTISYATVLPALFETAELLGALGLFRKVHIRPVRLRPAVMGFMVLAGFSFMVLPLFIPRYTFPMVWLGFTLLMEPFNYIWAAGSLLRDLEDGRVGRTLRLLAAGGICGLLWEAFNICALTKWIYTVPFFEGPKLFEMPIAGFLGFPPFAVECFVMVQFLGVLRGRPFWGDEELRPEVRAPVPTVIGRSSVAGAVIFSLFLFVLLDRHTVSSLSPRIESLRDLAPKEVEQLRGAGVRRLDLWILRDGGQVPAGTGLSPGSLQRWRRIAGLCTLRGIGTENGRLLLEAGITSIRDLARQDPQELASRLRAIQAAKPWARQPPRDPQVRIWVQGARRVCATPKGYWGIPCM